MSSSKGSSVFCFLDELGTLFSSISRLNVGCESESLQIKVKNVKLEAKEFKLGG